MISLLSMPSAVDCKVLVTLQRILLGALLALVLLLCPALAAQPSVSDSRSTRLTKPIDVSTLVKLEWAVETRQGDSQKLQLQIEPTLELQLPGRFKLTAIGRARGDAFDALEPDDPDQPEVAPQSRRLGLGAHGDLELREFYVKGALGRTFLTVGKQQIVWGQADGLKVLDVVNPQDFHEFILDKFDASRIPLWAVNAEIPLADMVLQLVWLPDQTYHDLPERGARFALTTPLVVPRVPPGVLVQVRDVQRPNHFFLDSDIGFRLSAFTGGWNITVNYLYHYDDLPVLFRQVARTPAGLLATVTPRYKRTHLMGGTFSTAVGNFVVRGELGFSLDRFLPTSNPMDADGVVKTSEFASVFGLDWSGLRKTFVSIQLFLNMIMDTPPGVFRDQVESIMTGLVRREFWNDSLVGELVWLQSLNRGDGLVRPRLRYQLRSNVTVWGGADVFYGHQAGLFGQFNQRDRIVLGIEWGF